MKIRDLLFTSLRNLSRRKVRTILTIIGVLIGSTSIIIMLSMGFGMEKTNEAFMEEMGDLSSILVYSGDSHMAENNDKKVNTNKKAVLNENSLAKLKEKEGVISALPYMEFQNHFGMLARGKDTGYGQILAIDFSKIGEYGFNLIEGELPLKKTDLIAGGYINESFQKQVGDNSIPIEVDLLKDKFKLKFEVYSEDEIDSKAYEYDANITAVLAPVMDETGYSIFMDIEYFKEISKELDKKTKEKTNLSNYSYAKLKMDKDADFEAIQNELREEGYIPNSMIDYFKEIQDNTKNTRNMFLIVGAVAFIVAAIGIANTMIMSVYERTKEIGVMKVIGASIKDIQNMFLMEATFIGLIGGILSIGFSYLISYLLNKLGVGFGAADLMMNEGTAGIVSYIPIWLPFIGVLFSTLVGLLSGYLPSRRATKISAIEAIRSQ